MKGFFKTIAYGAAGAIGYLLGVKVFNKFNNPVERTKMKKKFIKVKDAIFTKEES